MIKFKEVEELADMINDLSGGYAEYTIAENKEKFIGKLMWEFDYNEREALEIFKDSKVFESGIVLHAW